MVALLRPRIAFGAVAAVLALTAVAAYAAGQVPATISGAGANPKRFCAKSSDTCAHPGTTIRFTISTPAKVIGDARPRNSNLWGFRSFSRKFSAGAHSVRVNDSRFTTGKWTFRLQAINSVAASGPTNIQLKIVK